MKAKGLYLFLLLVLFLFSPSLRAYSQQSSGGTDDKATPKSLITGLILDAEGEPLPGVTVRIVKTDKAALTNVNGEFSIPGAAGQTLAISYIGKKPMQVKATVGKRMKITMEDDAESISEVVVT
ncbi:carboxypeptidase-like regulatory domain-containing protein, partial [uncultured Duncaniella sp.]